MNQAKAPPHFPSDGGGASHPRRAHTSQWARIVAFFAQAVAGKLEPEEEPLSPSEAQLEARIRNWGFTLSETPARESPVALHEIVVCGPQGRVAHGMSLTRRGALLALDRALTEAFRGAEA